MFEAQARNQAFMKKVARTYILSFPLSFEAPILEVQHGPYTKKGKGIQQQK